jgi:hypothetical protein
MREKPAAIPRYLKWFAAVCFGVPAILTVLPALDGAYGPAGSWCWILEDKQYWCVTCMWACCMGCIAVTRSFFRSALHVLLRLLIPGAIFNSTVRLQKQNMRIVGLAASDPNCPPPFPALLCSPLVARRRFQRICLRQSAAVATSHDHNAN